MTPREEVLVTGQLGQEGAALLYRTVRWVAAGNGFPPPPDSNKWDKSASEQIAHDFLEGERGARRIRDIAVRSMDDKSFERLLDAAVLNFLRDGARQTDLGKLILRVKEILREEPEFEIVPGKPDRWTLAGGEREPSAAYPGNLTAVIAGIKVEPPKWTSDRRDPPLADRPTFVLLMSRVLTAAEGSMTADDLARVLTSRLDHRRTALVTTMDVEEHVSERALIEGDPAGRTVAVLHAADFFDTLTDRERIILTDPEATVRELATRIGIGRSQANLIRQRLFDRLRDEFADDDDVAGAVVHVCELCEKWLQDRTREGGATSDD